MIVDAHARTFLTRDKIPAFPVERLLAELLVAPVLYPGRRRREVYLPKAARWRSTKTGAISDGGESLTVEAPLESMPVFVREGSRVSL